MSDQKSRAHATPEKHSNNRRSPSRSTPSSTSDHNKEAISPNPTEIETTGDTAQVGESLINYAADPLSLPRPALRTEKRVRVNTLLSSIEDVRPTIDNQESGR